MNTQYLLVAAVASYVTVAAITDLRARTIHNALTVPTAIAGLLFHAITNGWQGVGFSLAGFATGFALLLLPLILGGSGGGDVKLLAALGAWLGTLGVLLAFTGSVGVGALLALGVMGYSFATKGMSRTKRALIHTTSQQKHGATRKRARVLPFAIPVAMSTWGVLGWMLVKRGLGM